MSLGSQPGQPLKTALEPIAYAAPLVGSQPAPPQRQSLLNARFVAWSLVALVGVAGATFAWHRHQMVRNAAALLTQAAQHEADGQWRDAADLYYRYLQLQPEAADVREQLASAFDKSAASPADRARACELYVQAIPQSRHPLALRRRLATMLLELQRYSHASEEAERLLNRSSFDPVGLRIKALGSYGQSRATGQVPLWMAVNDFKSAIARNPSDIELAGLLADIYRREYKALNKAERATLADEVMDRMLVANRDQPEAILARATYRLRYGISAGEDDIARALELAPDNLDVLLAAGRRATLQNDLPGAREFYQRVIAAAPSDRRGYLGLGQTYVVEKNHTEALRIWDQGLKQLGENELLLRLRQAEILLVLGRFEETERALARAERRFTNVATTLTAAGKLRLRAAIDFVRAKQLFAREQYIDAIPLLKRVAVAQGTTLEGDDDIDRLVQIHYQLAACHTALQQFDLAAAAYDEASRWQPALAAHYLAAAEAWESAGQPTAAVKRYTQVFGLPGVPPVAWQLLARSYFKQQLRQPAPLRQWENFELALKEARDAVPDSPSVRLLAAQYDLQRGRSSEAIEQLKQLAAEAAPSRTIHETLILALDAAGRAAEADAALAQYQADAGDSRDRLELQLALLCARRQFDQAKSLIEATRSQATDAFEQSRLNDRLLQVTLQAGDIEGARAQLQARLEQDGPNLSTLVLSAELAYSAGDWNALVELERALESLEGADGTHWRLWRARRLTAQSEGPDDERLEQARSLLEELRSRRSAWSVVHLLQGQISDRQNRADDAIEAYEAAIDLGEASLFPYERLIALLYGQNRLAEAERYIERLSDSIAQSAALSSIAVSVHMQQGHLQQALRFATQAAETHPEDPWARLWLGQALQMAGKITEAEAAYRRALELDAELPQLWFALVGFLARQGQTAAARQTLEQLEKSPIAAGRRSFALAQGYELIGDEELAEHWYRQAQEASPDDLAVLERMASFFRARDPQLAERTLRHAVEIAPHDGRARRSLALLLTNRGTDRDWQEADQLLRADDRDDFEPSSDDLRVRAYLLTRRGGREAEQAALQAMEQVVQTSALVRPQDRLLLAHLYERDDRLQRAREQLLTLVSRKTPDPVHLAAMIDFQLRHEQWTEASSWLNELERLDPEDWRTITLRAKWLVAQDRALEVEGLVEKQMESKLAECTTDSERAGQMNRAAGLYTLVGRSEAAERWFRRAMQSDPKGYQRLASWLKLQNRDEEALALAQTAWMEQPSEESAILLCNLMLDQADNLGPAEQTLLSIEQALDRLPESLPLALSVGNVRFLAGDFTRAEQMFRKAAETDPSRNGMALNNLALVLAEDDSRREDALEVVERAFQAGARSHGLEDTRAVVLLRLGRTVEAITELERLTQRPVATPTNYLHLAQAYHSAGRPEEARVALKTAQERGLGQSLLSPRDRGELARIERELAE
jgi:tetratricopeptide (TPR) repeat protein